MSLLGNGLVTLGSQIGVKFYRERERERERCGAIAKCQLLHIKEMGFVWVFIGQK